MPAWRWTVYDPHTAVTQTFLVNPNAGGSPARKRTFAYENTAASGGRTLVFEGRAATPTLEGRGTRGRPAEYAFPGAPLGPAHQATAPHAPGRGGRAGGVIPVADAA